MQHVHNTLFLEFSQEVHARGSPPNSVSQRMLPDYSEQQFPACFSCHMYVRLVFHRSFAFGLIRIDIYRLTHTPSHREALANILGHYCRALFHADLSSLDWIYFLAVLFPSCF